MAWPARMILRKALITVIGAALVLGLLHGPSMMLASALASGIDCHDATAHAPTSNSHGHASQHDSLSPDREANLPAAGHPQAASSCPLANIVGIFTAVPNPPIPLHGVAVTMPELRELIATILDLSDPPPRSFA